MLWELALAMASSSFDFDRALAYALSCVKQEGPCLKDQQVEAVKRLSSLVPRPFFKTENRHARKGLGK